MSPRIAALHTPALIQLAAGISASTPVAELRGLLRTAGESFDLRYRCGEPVRLLVAERAAFLDLVVGAVWARFPWDERIALLAVGGYGRGELHPHSDIDLLLLTSRRGPDRYRDAISAFVATLWDLQLKIGHSVRTLGGCVSAARTDITIATNLMETRTIAGNPDIEREMRARTGPAKLWPSPKFFLAKRDEQRERHERHGNTEYNLEPNIKEAPGGLRDIQTIHWIAQRHFGVDSLKLLANGDLLTRDEFDQLQEAEEFLWRVRYGLHLLAGRAEECLYFDHQRMLAQQFGYRDTPQSLAVEQFMQRYYRTVLTVRRLNDMLLQYLDEEILHGGRRGRILRLNARFQIRNHYLEAIDADLFERDPSALLEVFVLLGEHPELGGIRSTTIRNILANQWRIDDRFRDDPRNQALFVRLLECKGNLSNQLQRMSRYGVLGAYLPEFGRIVGQMQHDLFHVYPVDAHTIQVVRNMRRLANQADAERFPIAAYVAKNLPKPELLYVAGLYHDIAKGRGGDHSQLGATEVALFARRHGFSEQEVRLLSWLVEHHLLMSATSQREDIDDPDVIHRFARLVGDQIHLDYLFVLTVADMNATNPTLWNQWKGALMRQLYLATREALDRGLENPINRREWIENARTEALELLAADGLSEARCQAIWGAIGEDFFLKEKASVIRRCTWQVHEQADRNPVIHLENAGVEDATATRVFVYTRGIGNVFPKIAAALDQLHLNVVDARLYAPGEGRTLNLFYALDERGQAFAENALKVRQVTKVLRELLMGPLDALPKPTRRISRQLKQLTTGTAAFISPEDQGHTRITVLTPDRPGLLAHLGRIFVAHQLQVHSAKIATLGERVEDIFYVTGAGGEPLRDPERCERLRRDICDQLDRRNREEMAAGAQLREIPPREIALRD
ncbi:MAG: [protein-PII] uridylyltransferase [Pseudomonadota bacterium]